MVVTPERLAEAHRKVTPELRARLHALTNDEIAAMIAADPDAAPELDAEWFDGARRVTHLKAAE